MLHQSVIGEPLGNSGNTMDDVISMARQIVPLGDGLMVAVESIAIETDESRFDLVWLAADGTVRERPASGTHAPSGTAPGPGTFVTLALAASRIEAVRRQESRLDEILARIATGAPLEVAANSRVLVVLTGERDEFDGSSQGLHRILLRSGGPSDATVLDLGPLALSPGRCITGLALQAGWLYAMVADPTGGFDVFRAPALSSEPRFEPFLVLGAQRFALNAAVSAIGALPEGLVLGSAALAPGAAQIGNWGPELLLLRHDGSWDILWGQPRFTPDGLKHPISDRLPGLGSPAHAAVKAIALSDDAGAQVLHVVLQEFSGSTVPNRQEADPDLLDYMGPARLLRSRNLVDWEEVPVEWPEGLGAITSLAVTPAGVLLGHERAGNDRPPITLLRLR